MAIEFECPHCRNTYKTKDENVGKKMRCKGCEAIVVIKPIGEPAQTEAAPKEPEKVAEPPKPKVKGDLGKLSALDKTDRKGYVISGRLAKMASHRRGAAAKGAKDKIAAGLKKSKVSVNRNKVKSSSEGRGKRVVEEITRKKITIGKIVIPALLLAIVAIVVCMFVFRGEVVIPPDTPPFVIEGGVAKFKQKDKETGKERYIEASGADFWVQGYEDAKIGDFCRAVKWEMTGKKKEIVGYTEQMVVDVRLPEGSEPPALDANLPVGTTIFIIRADYSYGEVRDPPQGLLSAEHYRDTVAGYRAAVFLLHYAQTG